MTPERKRELLENCAKACGYKYSDLEFDGETGLQIVSPVTIPNWNPLESSADESEMEAKLRLDVEWHYDHVAVFGLRTRPKEENYADHQSPQAARRMAGCRAAEAVYLESVK